MAVLKCKMCGGDLIFTEGASTAECDSCGSRQTIPTVDDEKKLTKFIRANRLRMACEFDKAAVIYESIVADFPEEAEAYWGLVLCKYGIEYVDDPADGRKVPTCHRSSFTSVREDPDFEQALENADYLARRLYREEAKQIEEIRKGIIEVSAKEAPYDIFICYKETDEFGDRTLDSVLAQEVYDALTDKGYRVFFSRISLEDKLGVEYEPYIFAALNSAKIMLAFGTDCEYFHAVWVKNEWSRFLKLMSRDKSRHLIPCYKGFDAYDMPKEFARLQAQDMGKVGAMQDLLRGIEKLLPRDKQPQAAVKETVVVQQAGGTNANALVKRGYMALEDGMYDKADAFFEDALNHDAECGEAYVGKFLARKKYRSLDAWLEVIRSSLLFASSRTEYLRRDTQKEKGLIEAYALPGFVHAEKADMQKILDKFTFTYESQVDYFTAKQQEFEQTLKNESNLNRGFRFAKGDYRDMLNRKRDEMLAQIQSCQKKALQSLREKHKKLEADYAAHLHSAEETFRLMRGKAEKERESRYADLCRQEQHAVSAADFERIGRQFRLLSGCKDADQRASRCDELRAQAQAKEAAQKAEQIRVEEARRAEQMRAEEVRLAEQRRLQEEQNRQLAKKRARSGAIFLVICAVAVAGIIFGIISFLNSREAARSSAYDAAEALYLAGDLDGAAEAFAELGGYEDAADRRMQILYEQAENLYTSGDPDSAAAAFAALEDYQDAADRRMQILYEKAENLLHSGSYSEAIAAFRELGDYQDSKTQLMAAWGGATQRKTVDCGDKFIAAVKSDGTVITTAVQEDWYDFDDKGQLDTSGWTDIVAVACGSEHTVGLRADGTVVAVGYNGHGQCDVSEWTDIVAIEACSSRTAGLRADGTVVVAGTGYWEEDHSQWTDIVSIHLSEDHLVGIRSDGTVVQARSSGFVSALGETWENISRYTIGDGIYPIALGVRKDGTVCLDDSWTASESDTETVESWRDIIDVCSTVRLTVALRSDGTVVYADHVGSFDSLDLSGWTDVTAIAMYGESIIGLRSDGTLLTVRFSDDTANILSQWTGIKIPVR